MSDYIEVRWQVDDGYVGKSRPQTTNVYLEDLDHCESIIDIIAEIENAVQDDFQQKICWNFRGDIEKVAENALAKIEEMRENE